MNVAPISAYNNVLNINSCKRGTLFNNKPAPELSVDKVTFKGYNEHIKEVSDTLYVGMVKSQCEKIFFELFEELRGNMKYAKTEYFNLFQDIFKNKGLHQVLKSIAGEKFTTDVEPFAKLLWQKAQKTDVVLASYDNIPIFELKTNDMPGYFERKFSLISPNIAELKLYSEFYGSSSTFGLNPRGELTFTQMGKFDLHKYTSFHNTCGNEKVHTSGIRRHGKFIALYYNADGSYNPFLSRLIR